MKGALASIRKCELRAELDVRSRRGVLDASMSIDLLLHGRVPSPTPSREAVWEAATAPIVIFHVPGFAPVSTNVI